MRPGLLIRAAVAGLIAAAVLLATAAAPAAPPSGAPIRLGYAGGDDWEPAIAADRFGHVYALWSHYGDMPSPRTEL